MTSPYKHLLPEAAEISDEAAAVLTEFLFRLAGACDVRYLAKILRYQDAQRQERNDVDPEQPWRHSPRT
jgi:hypothetical protein